MKLFTLLFIFIFLSACSLKSDQEESGITTEKQVVDLSKLDSDGDLVNDRDEINVGRNPHVADIPELRVRFLQNYKIDVDYKYIKNEEVGAFSIDTKVGRDDPNFKYRIGRIFIRDLSLNRAARVARFANHSWGAIKEHDLSWIKYPEVDPIFYSQMILNNKKYLDDENCKITGIGITLENSIRLDEMSHFQEIKNLELNFYYYNHETENYELLKTEIVDRHFLAGVNETFEVQIENAPKALLSENYLKRGEFIISEVKDFEIPELGIKYSELLKSVKDKTVTVVLNTPLESSHFYVSTKNSSIRFLDIMKDVFDKNYAINNNKLTRIGQFENNLSDFIYLKEVSDKDKEGRWYVLTQKINKHYLDHDYSSDDVVSLSYITGKELSRQVGEKITSFREEINGGGNFTIYPIGNVSPNSKIDIQIKPLRRWGEDRHSNPVEYHERRGSCGTNCISGYFHMDCYMEYITFSSYDHNFLFDDSLGNEELNLIKLVINGEMFSLQELLKDNLVNATVKNGYLHLTIDDITDIKEIVQFEENLLELRLETFIQRSSQGFKLVRTAGPHQALCGDATLRFAWMRNPKLPIATDSYEYSRWIHLLRPGALSLLNPRDYYRYFTVSMTTTIMNFHN